MSSHGTYRVWPSSTFLEALSTPAPGQCTDIPNRIQAMIVRSVFRLGTEALLISKGIEKVVAVPWDILERRVLALLGVCGYEESSDNHGQGVLISIPFLRSAARPCH